MDYKRSIETIKSAIQNREYEKAEEILLSLIFDSNFKNIEDENNTYYSFNNYIEYLLFLNIYKPQKQNVSPDINYAEVYYYLGYISIENKDLGKALEYLQEGLKRNPVDMILMFEIAAVYRITGNIEKFKEQLDKVHMYIYNSSYMSKYFRDLGWYYTEKRKLDLANALYSHSISFKNTEAARNQLKYIANQENRNLKFSTNQEVRQLLLEYNIPISFNKSMTQVLFNEYQYLNKNKSDTPILNYLRKTLYDITLDKQFMLYRTLKDDKLRVSIKVPEYWKHLEKGEYEKYNISKNTIFLLLTSNNQNVSVTCDGRCTNDQLKEAYSLNIDNMKRQGMEIIAEYSIEDQKNIKQVFVEARRGDKIFRVFQNYLVVNDFLFNVSWEVSNNINVEQLYNSLCNSLAMDVVWSLNKLEVEEGIYKIEFNNIIKEYSENGITSTLIQLINDLSNNIVKENKQDPIWSLMARNMLKTLILLDLPEENQLTVKMLLEQCSDIIKARQICKKNANKLDIAKIHPNEEFINSIKLLNGENNDKTVSSILEAIYKSIVP